MHGLPLDLWSDQDTQLVVCLTLLIRSAGFGRIEEANGTQLSVDHVAHPVTSAVGAVTSPAPMRRRAAAESPPVTSRKTALVHNPTEE